MLTLTENASTIVKDIAAQQGGEESTGLRISSEDPAQGLMVTAAQQPHPGDQTVESAVAWNRNDERPNFHSFTEPTKCRADLVVPNPGTAPSQAAIGALEAAVRALVTAKA